MIFGVSELVSLDICRDGGSLRASFRDKEGTQHELVFLIDNHAGGIPESYNVYKSASVASYIKSEYVSPITGISMPKTDKQEQNISWHDAINMLNEIEPFINNFNPDSLWIFKSMVIIAGNEKHEIEIKCF